VYVLPLRKDLKSPSHSLQVEKSVDTGAHHARLGIDLVVVPRPEKLQDELSLAGLLLHLGQTLDDLTEDARPKVRHAEYMPTPFSLDDSKMNRAVKGELQKLPDVFDRPISLSHFCPLSLALYQL